MTAKALLSDWELPDSQDTYDYSYLLNGWKVGDDQSGSLPFLVNQDVEKIQEEIVDWLVRLRATSTHPEPTVSGEAATDRQHQVSVLRTLHPIFEGNYATTPEFYLLAQLIALCQSLKVHGISALHYVGSRMGVDRCLRDWCGRNGLNYTSDFSDRGPQRRFRHAVGRLKRLAELLLIMLGNTGRRVPTAKELRYVFVDYFVGDPLDNYWGALPSELRQLHGQSTFVHNFTRHDEINSLWAARRRLRHIAAANRGLTQVLTEDLLRIGDFRRLVALSRHVKLTPPGRVGSTASEWLVGDLRADLLFSRPIQSGNSGSAAVESTAKFLAFDRLLRGTTSDSTIIYLLENHSWEKALLIAARTVDCRTIGVAHTVVRPLDLRYRIAAADLAAASNSPVFSPDELVVNGPAAARILADRLSEPRISVVEALRYRRLTAVMGPPRVPFTALLAGDLQPEHSAYVLSLAVPVLREQGFSILFKPHPADVGSLQLARELGLESSARSFVELSMNVSVVVVGSITAASAEAVHLGVPVVTIADPNYFDLSPLRNTEGAASVRTREQLREALLRSQIDEPQRREWFCLDTSLSRWRSHLVD